MEILKHSKVNSDYGVPFEETFVYYLFSKYRFSVQVPKALNPSPKQNKNKELWKWMGQVCFRGS